MDEFTDGENRKPGQLIQLPLQQDSDSKPTTIEQLFPGYSRELGLRICNKIIENAMSLKEVCASEPDFPPPTEVLIWATEIPEFKQAIAAARILLADHCAWETVRVLSEVEETINPANFASEIARVKALAQNYRWLASQVDPQRWGKLATPIDSPRETVRKIAENMSEAEILHTYLSATNE